MEKLKCKGLNNTKIDEVFETRGRCDLSVVCGLGGGWGGVQV